MSLSAWIHSFFGMEYPTSVGDGTGTTQSTKTTVHWEKGPGEPEEELKDLLDTIRQRVYTLKTVVEEQSKEIESTLEQTEKIVSKVDKPVQDALFDEDELSTLHSSKDSE